MEYMPMELERTLPLVIKARAETMPQINIQYSKDESGQFNAKTYESFFKEVQITAAGLLELGEKRGSHIGLISDNRQEWLVTDIAVLSIGAADVPRGCDSTDKEIAYILGFSECTLSFAENSKQVEKFFPKRTRCPC
jgi:long-chain acyl-CoA synthetase